MFFGIKRKFFPNDTRTLLQWQEGTFSLVFVFICVFSIPVLVRSIIQALHDELYNNVFLYISCYALALFITFFRFIPFRIRAVCGVAILFAAGMIAILTVGPLGSGRIFLFASGVFATLVLGIGYGIGVFILQAIVLTGYAQLLTSDFAGWSNIELFTPSSWVTSSSTFIFLSLVFVIAIGRMIGGLSQTFTRLRQANLGLLQSEGRFQAVLENANDIIFELEASVLTISYVSSTCASLLGYDQAEVVGRSFRGFVHPDDLWKAERLLRNVLEQGIVHPETEYRLLHASGGWRWHQIKGGPLKDAEGHVVAFVGISRDVTERKEIEAELLRARDEADSATRAKSEFLANMSHEIRTPLNGVMGMIQLMQMEGLDEEQAGFADTAMESCRRLVRLLTDILDISRIEANMLTIRHEPMELREVLDQTAGLFSAISRESGVDLAVRLDPTIPERLYGDAARLQQVLTNLVGNALKFTPSGGVSLDATRLGVSRNGRCRVLFSVQDTGIGIPDDKLEKLFRPFSQVSEGFTRSHQGAGLGLSICRRLVGLMGGNMAVSSEAGVGTEVHFALGFDTEGTEEQASPQSARAPEISLTGVRILLAEDDRFSMVLAEKLFRMHGAMVEVAQDGHEALEILGRSYFDLVFMDIQMPRMDGIEATRAIREGRAGAKMKCVPIIAMTAYAMRGDRERILEAGMDGYVSKPFEVEDLLRTIADVIRRRLA